mgnify:CR=1 FL=1
MAIIYPSLKDAMDAHEQVIRIGGGLSGVKDVGQIESVLQHIQNDDYYPSFEEKLAHLSHSLCKFHCFNDGNKRTGLAVTVQMLEWNNCDYCVHAFIRNMENIVVAIAEDRISKALLQAIIAAHLYQTYDDNEELKLQVLDALTKPI